jgi:periplasmic divalent cation tolerance protein
VSSVDDARRLVKALVHERVIACGTILPAATSIFRWKNEVKEESEAVVLLKTEASRWDALVAAVRARHPYEVPELLAFPAERGLQAYLDWLEREVVT